MTAATASAASTAFLSGWLMMAGLIVAIGAQNALVLRQGLARRHVGVVVLFCTVSDLLLIAAGVFGLGAIIGTSPVLMQVMRFGGAAFLLWCGARAAARAWRGHAALQAGAGGRGWAGTLGTAAALTWLNPHVYLDTVVLLGSVGAQQAAALRPAFAAGAGLASAMWFVALGYGASALAPRLARPGTWRALDAGVAVVMVVVALQLLARPL
jgi:L-lysine exporter family protein LysE/ArgO